MNLLTVANEDFCKFSYKSSNIRDNTRILSEMLKKISPNGAKTSPS